MEVGAQTSEQGYIVSNSTRMGWGRTFTEKNVEQRKDGSSSGNINIETQLGKDSESQANNFNKMFQPNH